MTQERHNAIVKHGARATLKSLMQDKAIGQSFLWSCKINDYRRNKNSLIPVSLVSVDEQTPGNVMITPDKGFGAFSVEHTEIYHHPTKREISQWLKAQEAEAKKDRLLKRIKEPFLRQSFSGLKQSLNAVVKGMSGKDKKIAIQEANALAYAVKGDEIKVTSRHGIEGLIKNMLNAVYGIDISESEMRL